MMTVLLGVDQNMISGLMEVVVISCGNFNWQSRSTLMFHSPPVDRKDHTLVLLL